MKLARIQSIALTLSLSLPCVLLFQNCTGGFSGETSSPAASIRAGASQLDGYSGAAGCAADEYDMLAWMTPADNVSPNHQLAPDGETIFTTIAYTGANQGTIALTKTNAGNIWDINLFDENGVYFWATSYDFADATNIGVYVPNGASSTPVKMFPRCAKGGFPGTVTRIPASQAGSLETTYGGGNCSVKYQGPNQGFSNEIWGPYNLSLGGNLPANTPTLVFAYRYNCNASFSVCNQKEEQYYQKGAGWVMWKLYNWDGTQYVQAQETDMTKTVTGPMPAFQSPCDLNKFSFSGTTFPNIEALLTTPTTSSVTTSVTTPMATPKPVSTPSPTATPTISTSSTPVPTAVSMASSTGWMSSGQILVAGQQIMSQNGQYLLAVQTDGNVVLYGPNGALWATNTGGKAINNFIMQYDGNLVLYSPTAQPLWASNTAGNPGARLAVQNDGNLVVYSSTNQILWSR